MTEEMTRCWTGSPLMQQYHDDEWGRPVHDDRQLFEMLTLEVMQAGLSWNTVLNKREAFRQAFDGFDPSEISQYDEDEVQQLVVNPGIIRNRMKIDATINNARQFLSVADECGSFDEFIWRYVDFTPIVGHPGDETWVATTPLSDQISKDLKKKGFKFVGSTTIYSFLQSVGIVNDHLPSCFVYKELLVRRQPASE